MNKQIPTINRVLHRRQFQRCNELHLQKLMNLKFSNISSLNNPGLERKIPKPRQLDIVKFTVSSDNKPRRVKTVLEGDRIKEENKILYSRLVSQKATIPSKALAEDRHKNVEYLKRIGRYPYKRVQSVANHSAQEIEAIQKSLQSKRHRTQYYSQDDDSFIINLRTNTNKSTNLNFHLVEEEKRQHLIVLYSKVVQIAKNWYIFKFLRFKNHYEIKLISYPHPKVEYNLKLAEDIGTSMLTENDYDYVFIYQKFIKVTHQYVCLSFEVKHPQKKKHFYRFEKKVSPTVGEEDEAPEGCQLDNQIESKNGLRKTLFALQNQKRQREKIEYSRRRFKNTQIDEDAEEEGDLLNATQAINIRLSSTEL